jgi:diadenosine tetraphosphatase ApaH/serine/threonine PP2A family protein phosphatase
MRLALLADIHANPPALEACLARAAELGATQLALLGDLVGYGPDPATVVERIRGLEAAGAWVLRGNHDTLAAAPPAEPKTVDEAGARWTHDRLGAAERAWLAALPLQRVEPPCLLVHASADAPAAWRYVNNPLVAADSLAHATNDDRIRYVLGGHVHLQALWYQGRGSALMLFEPSPGKSIPVPGHRRWLATVGSVGQPRDGNPAAAFALLDTDAATLAFHRVPYDVGATVALARRAGAPADAIRRLETAR